METKRRGRDIQLARLAVSLDTQPRRREPLWRDLMAQDEGGKRLQLSLRRWKMVSKDVGM